MRAWGWDDGWEAAWADSGAGDSGRVPGRVVRVDRGSVEVVTAAGDRRVRVDGAAVGDWVAVAEDGRGDVLERRTVLARASVGRDSGEQLLAANVDLIGVVEPLRPTANPRRVERLLTLAWAGGAPPVVVLTKADLAEPGAGDPVRSVAVGAELVEVSTVTGQGIDEVRELVRGRTFALVGPSGAGKSSLVNALAGEQLVETGEVRGDGRGRHTTTAGTLIALPGIGWLVDTPGLRTVGMTGAEDGLDRAFADIADLAEDCRFADCAHRSEPGCAVLAAVDDGSLDPARLDSYRRLEREIASQARRRESKDRAAERRDGRAHARGVREVMAAKNRR